MDIKAFPALIVGVVVALVLAGAVLPVFAETTSAEDTFKNEGYYNLTKLDNTSNTVMVWDTSKPAIITVDNVDIDVPTTGRLTLLGSDSICIRYNAGSNAQIQVFGSYSGSQDYKALSASSSGTMTITVTAGVVSVAVNTDTVKSFDLGNDAYIIAPDNTDSDYVAVMKLTTEQAYLLGDSEIVICGISVSNNQSQAIGVFAKGTMDDDINFSTFFVGSSYSGDVTFTDITTYSTEKTNYNNLYQLEKYTATINYNGGQTSNATYSYFIVPSEVTAEKAVHPDGPLTVILNVLPLLAIAGLVTGAVVWFINRKG